MTIPTDNIQPLAVMAALFHDFGKASDAFQEKLRIKKKAKKQPIDDYRHEWVSVILFASFVNSSDNQDSDQQWLQRLQQNDLHQQFINIIETQKYYKKRLGELPPIAQMVAWLILSHHFLPTLSQEQINEGKHRDYNEKSDTVKAMLTALTPLWGYTNTNNLKKSRETQFSSKCFQFSKGLPSQDKDWQKKCKQIASNLQQSLNPLQQSITDRNDRLILTLARTCLMLADHNYSSKQAGSTPKNKLKLHANTKKNNLDQLLVPHLLGVAEQTESNCNNLNQLLNLPTANKKQQLNKPSKSPFKWQNEAVTAIKQWRQQSQQSNTPFGFFGVNLASTGTGKTFANAKIMQALSPTAGSLRYILALGLRTLTLQTGDEYRKNINLNEDELGVIIGSKAIQTLHSLNQTEKKQTAQEQTEQQNRGSESNETLLDEEIHFTDKFTNTFTENLNPILPDNKAKKLLYAPVLACTIDQIIGATENTKGGKQILPTFRLISSDLVIDEVDDFEPEDLVAIGRLVHLTGMLGRKVILSSATITPDIAEGFFKAYQAGWKIYANTCNLPHEIGCFWSNEHEFGTKCETVQHNYNQHHNEFIQQQLNQLNQTPIKRQAYIAECSTELTSYFPNIKKAIKQLHDIHHFTDPKTNKKISLGVIRIANILPVIQLTKYLLTPDHDKSYQNYQIKTMAYHSQQLLVMRNEQEKYLDTILKRKHGDEHILQDPHIRKHIDNSSQQNILFVVVATPVEEVGRDHDFDWAVIEPSSIRSIIQMAGRVFRHRQTIDKQPIHEPNIAIMQYNYRNLKTPANKTPFRGPGFQRNPSYSESSKVQLLNKLPSQNGFYDLCEITHFLKLSEHNGKRLDASERLQKENLSPLAQIEHTLIEKYLQSKAQTVDTLTGWNNKNFWLTNLCQQAQPFRSTTKEKTLYLYEDSYEKVFYRKATRISDKENPENEAQPISQRYNINDDYQLEQIDEAAPSNLWFTRNYQQLLREIKQRLHPEKELNHTAYIYGEINIREYDIEKPGQFQYCPDLGLWKEKEEEEE